MSIIHLRTERRLPYSYDSGVVNTTKDKIYFIDANMTQILNLSHSYKFNQTQ